MKRVVDIQTRRFRSALIVKALRDKYAFAAAVKRSTRKAA